MSNDTDITAKSAFKRLKEDVKRWFRTRFDAWQDGQINKKWYHGWDQSEYRGKYIGCFVFKHKESRLHHRFYGFLCHPRLSDRSYQVCILVHYILKKGWETDEADLKKVEAIRAKPVVQTAIAAFFREKP